MYIGGTFLLLIVAVAYTMIFRVKDVYLGLPSDFFRGRIKREKDDKGFSVPIRRPYKEGIQFKLPWITVKQIPSGIRTQEFKEREYQLTSGGTVTVKGLIQWRPSPLTLYRFAEYSEEEIREGLDSDAEQKVGKIIGDPKTDTEKILTRQARVAEELCKRFDSEKLYPDEEGEKGKITRSLFGSDDNLSYSENSYGVEVVKVKLDINPGEKIKEARDNKLIETFEKSSETTELNHLLERTEAVAKKLDIPLKDAYEKIEVWQEKATRHIQEIKMSGLEEAAHIIAKTIGNTLKSALFSIANRGKHTNGP